MTQKPGALLGPTIDTVSATEILALEASLAGRRLAERERTPWNRWSHGSRAIPRRMERLAVLAREAGRTDCAVKCLQDKAAIDRAKERYRDLLATGVLGSRLEELATLAETLGRTFEARGWWTLLVVAEPDNPKFRAALDRLRPETASMSGRSGQTLADLLADLGAALGGPRPTDGLRSDPWRLAPVPR